MNKIAHLTTKAPIAVHMYSGGRFGGNLNDFLSNLVLRKELMVIIMKAVIPVAGVDALAGAVFVVINCYRKKNIF